MAGRCIEAGRRDLLDLERHDVAMLGEISSGVGVVEGRGNESIDDATRCTVGVWIECVYVVAKRARRHGRHAAELSATEDADRGAGQDRCSRQVVLSRPAMVAISTKRFMSIVIEDVCTEPSHSTKLITSG